jgi:hypothetical protein
LLQAKIKASGDGPNGCHHRQNGIAIGPAGWNFDMGGGEYPEGLNCSVWVAGYFTAINGFQYAIGRWCAIAIELDYSVGQAWFWLDGQLVWTTPFDTNFQADRLWMSSGEGRGWFDDVLVCELVSSTPVTPATWGHIKSLYR